MQRALQRPLQHSESLSQLSSEETTSFFGVQSQTWGRYQHCGLAAAETVQQRLAADVLVEESHGRAQLGQSQPRKHEGGLIPHEKSHRVPSVVPRQRLQSLGYFVADSVGVGVGVACVFKNNKGFVRMGSGLLQETIQDEEERSPPSPRRVRQENREQIPAIQEVQPEKGTKSFQRQWRDEHRCDNKWP